MSPGCRTPFQLGAPLGLVTIILSSASAFAAPLPLPRYANVLEAQLVQARAIARDLKRYRAELAQLDQRLGEAQALLQPNLEKLRSQLALQGTTMRGPTLRKGAPPGVRSIELGGRSKAALRTALEAVADACPLCDVEAFEIGSSKFALRVSMLIVPLVPEPRPDRRRGRPNPGQGDRELWAVVVEREKELDLLDEKLGDINDFGPRMNALKAGTALISNWRQVMISPAVIHALFIAKPPIFDVATMERSEGLGRVRGRTRAPSISERSLGERLGPAGYVALQLDRRGERAEFRLITKAAFDAAASD